MEQVEQLRKALGEQAKALRQESGIRQKDLATLLGLQSSEISRFEQTGQRLGLERVLSLFDALGYELQAVNKKTTIDIRVEKHILDDLREMIEEIDDFPESDRLKTRFRQVFS